MSYGQLTTVITFRCPLCRDCEVVACARRSYAMRHTRSWAVIPEGQCAKCGKCLQRQRCIRWYEHVARSEVEPVIAASTQRIVSDGTVVKRRTKHDDVFMDKKSGDGLEDDK